MSVAMPSAYQPPTLANGEEVLFSVYGNPVLARMLTLARGSAPNRPVSDMPTTRPTGSVSTSALDGSNPNEERYSARKASTGSTLVAIRAGRPPASVAARISPADTAPYVSGSAGLTSY